MAPSDHAAQGSRPSNTSFPQGNVSTRKNERAHRLSANGYGTGNSHSYFDAPVTDRLVSWNQTQQRENRRTAQQYLQSWDEQWARSSGFHTGYSSASSLPECHPLSNNTSNYDGGIPEAPRPSSENTLPPNRPGNPGGKEDAFHKLFHSVSQWYRDWLRRWASSELPNQDGEEHQTTTGTASSGRSQSHQQQRRDKRKRQDGDRDSERHDGNKRRGGSDQSPATMSEDEKLRLACPFFKRNPMKYIDCQFCLHHWPNTSRLKEHLYQRHLLPGIQCGLCGAEFSSQSSFQEHQLQSGACERLGFEPREGVDALTRIKLQDKKIARGATEEDKWRAIYAILFPKDDPSAYPSPYYDVFPVVRQQMVRLLQDETQSIVENAVNHAINNVEATTTTVARQLRTDITASITESINSSLRRFRPEHQPWEPNFPNGEIPPYSQDPLPAESSVEAARRDVADDFLQLFQTDLENDPIPLGMNDEELSQFFDFSLSPPEHAVLQKKSPKTADSIVPEQHKSHQHAQQR
ncbi:hypothetical protein ANO14919_030020 [Xylariales sp. No.14919]|nr:hypothetical protein ANO14919_030020 [Xylariales sp. No.14919]